MTSMIELTNKARGKLPKGRRVVNRLIDRFVKAGCEYVTHYCDGDGDSVKLDVIFNRKKFLVAFETNNKFPVMDDETNEWFYPEDFNATIEAMVNMS